jgi:hypothetical protein
MTTGFPKQPTYRSIVIGIGLFLLLLLAFFRIPEIVKYTGAVLMYIPSKIGLVDMVKPREVIAESLANSPTTVALPERGAYALYTENYDLLNLHNAAVESGKLDWIKIQPEASGQAISFDIVDRGLALYDTPFARGRPLLTFSVPQAGRYQIIHPTRPDTFYIVPDDFTGKESAILLVICLEVGLIFAVVSVIFMRRDAPRRLRKREVQLQARRRIEQQKEKIRILKEMNDEDEKEGQIMDEYEPDNLWKKK